MSESSQKPHVLVVDDEAAVRRAVMRVLDGMSITEAENGLEAKKCLERDTFDAVVTDLRMPHADGFDVIKFVGQSQARTPVLMLTGMGSIADCVAAIRAGASNFLAKPFQSAELRRVVDEMLTHHQPEAVKRTGTGEAVNLVGDRLDGVLATIERVAKHDATVLITGESGTGKELVARLLHTTSGRAAEPYVAINCGAIPENLIESELFGHVKGAFTGAATNREGVFQRANGGTLFLDELGELPKSLQVKLIRVLQEQELTPVGSSNVVKVDVRVVAATLRDIEKMVADGEFREDLYYRLNVIPIELPPLRAKPGDVVKLANYFLTRANRKYDTDASFEPTTLAILQSYAWPGNVRQLENLVERLVLTTAHSSIRPDDLPQSIRDEASSIPLEGVGDLDSSVGTDGVNLPELMSQFESQVIENALRATDGNKSRAAELLNIHRTTLIDKLKRAERNSSGE